jgi:nitrogen fixation protein FixH
MTARIKGQFTGWHMTVILVVFFGVVMTVNFTMARMAIGTFGGTVVDNSYVASQNYNRWLDAAERQDRLGWTVHATLTQDRFVIINISKGKASVTGVTAVADAIHPLGRASDIPLEFRAMPDGRMKSMVALPAGRWTIQVSLRQNADIYKFVQQFQ